MKNTFSTTANLSPSSPQLPQWSPLSHNTPGQIFTQSQSQFFQVREKSNRRHNILLVFVWRPCKVLGLKFKYRKITLNRNQKKIKQVTSEETFRNYTHKGSLTTPYLWWLHRLWGRDPGRGRGRRHHLLPYLLQGLVLVLLHWLLALKVALINLQEGGQWSTY